MNWKSVLIGMSIVFVLLVGCQFIQNKLTPADIPPELAKYAGYDPNHIGIPSLDKLNKIKFAADLKNLTTQLDYEYLKTKDQAVYSKLAEKYAELKAKAEQDKEFIFGAGGLITIALGLLGGASTSGWITSYFKDRTMYSETEHTQLKTDAVNTAVAAQQQILYTEEEVAAKVAAAIANVKAAAPVTPA